MGVVTEYQARHYFGAAADMASVPAACRCAGDIYYQTDTKASYAWDGAAWRGPVPADWITAAMLKTDSVETLKIKNLNVTEGKLANLAVAEGKLGNLSVSAGKLKTDAVETLKIKNANVTLVKLAADARGRFENALLHIQDQKASGTNGGTFTQDAWRTRDLNTVLTNEIPSASLSSNQITLPAGTYYVEAFAPCYRGQFHKAKLYNITDTADILIGTTEYNFNGADYVQTSSHVVGRFTIAGTKVIELQHYCKVTAANVGFGSPGTFAVVELYSDIRIWKL